MINRVWLASFVLVAVACSGGPPSEKTASAPDPISPAPTLLGLTVPVSEAEIFAPGVVSVQGRYEYALSIHPSGKRLLYTVEAPDQGAAVYQIRVEAGHWSTPERVDLTSGERRNEMEAFFSPDGDRIYFAPFDAGMDVRIWTAEVTPVGFAESRPLSGPIAEYPTFFPVPAADGSLYHTNLAARTAYRARFEGGRVVDTEPVGVGRAGHAFPSPDGRFLLVDSASPDSADQRDIFVAHRNDDGSWGPPQALGPEVNTSFSETCPTLSPDGTVLFFSRYDEPERRSNIYWISSDVVAAPAPVVE
jgi:Tol biopolymer transport system component